MKLEITFKVYYILLILFSLSCNAEGEKSAPSCADAMSAGQPEKALIAAETALKKDATTHEAWLCKGRALGALGQYAEAQKAMEQGIKTTTSDYNAGIANLLLGNLHKQNQAYMLASQHYQKSLSLFEQQQDTRFIFICHVLLGEAYALDKNPNAALVSYQVASKAANNDNERADSYARVAQTYAALGQHDHAIEHQLKSVMMQKKAGTLDQYASATLQLGQYQTQAKDYKNAENTYTKLRDFAKENGGAYYEAKASLALAKNAWVSGDAGSAKTHLANAESIAKTINDKELNAETTVFAQTMQK